MKIACTNRISLMYGYVLAENKAMLSFVKKFNAEIIWEGSPQLLNFILKILLLTKKVCRLEYLQLDECICF